MGSPLRLVLYQPDIPQNAGAVLRLAACLGLPVDVVEPCGFVWSESRMRRTGMDYLNHVTITRHRSWVAYMTQRQGRLVLLTTKGAVPYTDFAFQPGDSLMIGQESAGVPEEVHAQAEARLLIPMRPGMRSLNAAISLAMVTGEALRQIKVDSC